MHEVKTADTALRRTAEKRLESLAESTGRSSSSVVAEAIREYIDTNEWQIKEIKRALKEVDRGDFASDAMVRKTVRKWIRVT
jgi:predicted transcriptional regulator